MRDLDAAPAFDLTGLGWRAELDLADVVMIRTGEHLVLSLWDRAAFRWEVAWNPGPIGEML